MKHAFHIILFIILAGSKLPATSIIPFRHLGEAVQLSDAAVLATVEQNFETPSGNCVYFDGKFRVITRIKGDMTPGETFILRQQSYRTGDFNVDFAGDFVPETGKTYLIFLKQYAGYWKPVTMTYFIFEVKKTGDESFLVPLPETFSIALVPRPDGVLPEPPAVYRLADMLHILQQYSNGITSTWDASAALTTLLPDDFPQERVLPTGCSFDLGSGQCRWQNAAINIYFDDTNVPAGFSGTLDNILSALNTNYTGIDPVNSGQVSFTPDCSDGTVTGTDFTSFLTSLNGNQTTLIIFDDPCNQIPNLSGCVGTLAVGGGYSSSATHVYKGETWKNALWGYVVVNNGVTACLTASEYEIMLTHELTHTYRMGHLNAAMYPNQNMNPVCCNPINTKDMECMNYTYDIALPVKLVSFEAHPARNGQVDITWTTASENETDHFVIERSADGLRFDILANIPARNTKSLNRYNLTDETPFSGLSYYRLSEVGFDGKQNNLGLKAVEIGQRDGEVSVYPDPVNDGNLTLKTNFVSEFSGSLEIVDMNGRVVTQRSLSLNKGEQTLEQPVDGLTPGIYWMKLESANSLRVLRFYKN